MRQSRLVQVNADGARFTAVTLTQMRAFTRAACRDINWIQWSRENVLMLADDHDTAGQAAEALELTRRCARYVMDPTGVELVQSPTATLELGYGDCDDLATLYGSLACAIGIPTRYRAVATTPGPPDHVFAESLINGHWTAAEACLPVPLGWRVPEHDALVIEAA